MDYRILADDQSWQARTIGSHLYPCWVLRGETQYIGCRDSDWEDPPAGDRNRSDLGAVGLAHSECGLPPPVVQTLAQPLDDALTSQAGQRLRYRRKSHTFKIRQTPHPVAVGLDSPADGIGCRSIA